MKKCILFILFFTSIQLLQAQEKVYTQENVEIDPDFPGGREAFIKYVAKNYQLPEDITEYGTVEVNFIVETTGKISNVKVVKDIGGSSAEQAIKVISASPKWKPGMVGGQAVRVLYSYPIKISGN
jgi:periplasmic protein TonB